MLVVFVTHPEAKDVSRGHVRALSKKGKESAHEVGTRLLSMLPLLFKEYGIEEADMETMLQGVTGSEVDEMKSMFGGMK